MPQAPSEQISGSLSAPHTRPPLRASVRRGTVAESSHLIYVAESDAYGNVTACAGDPLLVTTMRSSAKPLQVIPALVLPGAEQLNLSDEEVAICCSSHPGQPRHAALAASVLALSGFLPDNLVCGGVGYPSSPLRHGCSGNHAAILLVSHLLGVPLEGYEKPDHPAQREILRIVANMSGDPSPVTAPDGCGVPTFGISLASMARAFATLTKPNAQWERVPHAMGAHPELVGPSQWIDVPLMQATRGRLIAKTGAEGLVCIGMTGKGLGAAIKVLDGSTRSLGAAAVAWLYKRQWITREEAESPLLCEYRRPVITGVEHKPVGEIVIEED